MEAVFEKEALRYPPVHKPAIDALSYQRNYHLNNFSTCICVLILFGLVMRIVAFLCLRLSNRGQQL